MDSLPDTQPVSVKPRRPKLACFAMFLLAVLLFGCAAALGGAQGYQAGKMELAQQATLQSAVALREQFDLGVRDLDAGRYDLARQRFAYILTQAPGYPGADERLAQVMQIVSATATPTRVPPTVTPTPTEDLRPVEDIYQQALFSFETGDWEAAINTLIALRREDPAYQVVAVDSLMYQALMNRGIDKIRKSSNLEGGIYDLTLAERFGPLDARAQGWRNLARYYLIGSSFWQVNPELAVYYFGVVASGAPYLRDASGWTARERYRASLVDYAAQLAARGDWCSALEQYNLALAIRGDETIEAQANAAALQCSLLTVTVIPLTPTPSLTPTLTGTLISPSPSPEITASATWTAIVSPLPTGSPTPLEFPSATPTILPLPTATLTPSPTPIPSETPAPSPSP